MATTTTSLPPASKEIQTLIETKVSEGWHLIKEEPGVYAGNTPVPGIWMLLHPSVSPGDLDVIRICRRDDWGKKETRINILALMQVSS
jgi:hypothetical protein